ncbi:MAG: hypothetical protein JWM16_1247 [Verrucomicrobiales bacterium]|nr:hypothetical protein [Verrucomicrobiales bacterium]
MISKQGNVKSRSFQKRELAWEGEGLPPEPKYYFVDEAGDPTLFGSRGKVLVGADGCSRFFILGLVDVEDPSKLSEDLAALGAQLLGDPYFKDVPSMKPEAHKTALLFHAKDDLPEVRREVFKLLLQHKVRFSGIVRDKLRVLAYVRRRNETDPNYRYNPNELYDFLVRRLFKERLHTHGSYRICFARRGTSDRTSALTHALETARQEFAIKQAISANAPIEVVPASPVREPGLQAVDYFLWALQRTFERHEDRFLQLLWPQCSLVVDADDTRAKGYGAYYTKQKPLTAAALKEAEGYRSESPR